MKQFIYYIIILTFFLSESFAQSLFHDYNNNIPADEIIAEVGPIIITAEEFFYNYEFGPSFTKKVPNSKTTHLKYIVQEKLLTLEAIDQGLIDKNIVKNVHDDIVGDLATEELFKDKIIQLIKVDSSEIAKAIEEKSIDIELKWLFTNQRDEAEKLFFLLENKVPFDSLYSMQLNDSVYSDQRSLKISLFDLRKKNPKLYKIYFSLNKNEYSKPIEVNNSWYILNLVNQTKSLLQTQSEYDQQYSKSLYALTKIKMDSLSDLHVNNLMLQNNPIIKREVFTLLRSYIGKFNLDSNTFRKWELLEKKESVLNKMDIRNNSEYKDLILVETASNNYTLEDFINWYRNRELHLKFQKENLIEFSKSLESMVWRMVRDKLLIAEAKDKNYYQDSWVKKQSTWWKDKITYSVFRNVLLNSLKMEINEIMIGQENNIIDDEAEINSNQKIFQLLNSARKKYHVTINHESLDKITVSTENDEHAIDFYTAKNGGLIPRPAYPSIDNDWVKWQ